MNQRAVLPTAVSRPMRPPTPTRAARAARRRGAVLACTVVCLGAVFFLAEMKSAPLAINGAASSAALVVDTPPPVGNQEENGQQQQEQQEQHETPAAGDGGNQPQGEENADPAEEEPKDSRSFESFQEYLVRACPLYGKIRVGFVYVFHVNVRWAGQE